MNQTFSTRAAFKTAFLAMVLLTCAKISAAADKNWAFNAGGSWSNSGNWNPTGVPGAGDVVNVTGFLFNPVTVTYNYAGPDVTLNSLTLDAISPATLTFNMSSGNLITNTEFVADGGTGETQATVALMDVSGGINTINTRLVVGNNANDTGTYLLRNSARSLPLTAPSRTSATPAPARLHKAAAAPTSAASGVGSGGRVTWHVHHGRSAERR